MHGKQQKALPLHSIATAYSNSLSGMRSKLAMLRQSGKSVNSAQATQTGIASLVPPQKKMKLPMIQYRAKQTPDKLPGILDALGSRLAPKSTNYVQDIIPRPSVSKSNVPVLSNQQANMQGNMINSYPKPYNYHRNVIDRLSQQQPLSIQNIMANNLAQLQTQPAVNNINSFLQQLNSLTPLAQTSIPAVNNIPIRQWPSQDFNNVQQFFNQQVPPASNVPPSLWSNLRSFTGGGKSQANVKSQAPSIFQQSIPQSRGGVISVAPVSSQTVSVQPIPLALNSVQAGAKPVTSTSTSALPLRVMEAAQSVQAVSKLLPIMAALPKDPVTPATTASTKATETTLALATVVPPLTKATLAPKIKPLPTLKLEGPSFMQNSKQSLNVVAAAKLEPAQVPIGMDTVSRQLLAKAFSHPKPKNSGLFISSRFPQEAYLRNMTLALKKGFVPVSPKQVTAMKKDSINSVNRTLSLTRATQNTTNSYVYSQYLPYNPGKVESNANVASGTSSNMVGTSQYNYNGQYRAGVAANTLPYLGSNTKTVGSPQSALGANARGNIPVSGLSTSSWQWNAYNSQYQQQRG